MLDQAAKYQAKIDTAKAEAKTLKGTIDAAETTLLESEAALAALPGEQQTADLGVKLRRGLVRHSIARKTVSRVDRLDVAFDWLFE